MLLHHAISDIASHNKEEEIRYELLIRGWSAYIGTRRICLE